jgi:two-component system chemotaxis sensor kinase CheA
VEEELRIFLSESYETLNSLDRELIQLGKNPESEDILRTIHANFQTFLESSKFLHFSKLESLTHIGERLITQLIQSDSEVSGEMITTILKLNMAIREIIFHIDEKGSEPSEINNSIIRDVEEVIKKKESEGMIGDINDVTDIFMAGTPTPGVTSESDLTDRLMNTVVEMIHVRERLFNFRPYIKSYEYSQIIARMSGLVSDVYTQVRSSKTQPVGTLVLNLDKIIKDTAKQLGKSVILRIIGKEREVDAKLLEGLRIALVQILHNSVTHGIERTDQRIAHDKSPDGSITIECYQSGELFHSIVSDDGEGLDPDKIRKKLVEKSVLFTEEASKIPDDEVVHYIFKDGYAGLNEAGGFIGGRPSGLDIAKAKIETMGGRIFLKNSQKGRGVDIHLTLPQINAIVPVVCVNFGKERYAIPKIYLVEIVPLDSESLIKGIEVIQGNSVFIRRGKRYPLIYMKQVLRYEDPDMKELPENPLIHIIILENDGMQFAMVADGVTDMEEAVVRSLSSQLSGIFLFSGATILSDEKPSLILDIGEIQRHYINSKAIKKIVNFEEVEMVEPATEIQNNIEPPFLEEFLK